MKRFIIGTAFTLAIASFGAAAYANNVNSSNTQGCRSVPIARPSGGATRERIAALENCNYAASNEEQTPSTSQMTQPTSPSEEPSQTEQNQVPSGSSVQPSTPGSMTMPSTPTDTPSGMTNQMR